ncbi:MAG: glycosyltransferase family 39 protein, partial [Haloarculaceae archaeon]
ELEADPYLPYLLAFAALTFGFGIWYRVPNFAEPDEYSRLIQPMKVAGRVAADPSLDSLQTAVLDGRALGATMYLFGAVLAPVFLVVLVTGQLGEFVALGTIQSRWDLWHAAPAWFWTAAVLLGRLVTVTLGVGAVYLTYRIGTELRDRVAGRVAALFLSLSVGVVGLTHTLNEDVPMLFFLLLTVLLATRYAERGDRRYFLWGALTGGLAIAFKLSGGVGAVVLGVAYLDRARRAENTVDELRRPVVVLGGLAVGLLTITVGIPSVLVGGPGELLARATGSIASKTTRAGGLDAPLWYWFVRQYVRALGVPLFLAAVIAVIAALARTVRERRDPSPLAVLLAASVLVFYLVYARWEFVRMRHLVPTVPVFLAVMGAEISRLYERTSDREGRAGRSRFALRVGLGFLVVTGAAPVAAAELDYVTEPRDGATDWLAENADGNATVEVYENSIADVGVPHGQPTGHYPFQENRATNTSSLVLNETAYTQWMLATPERDPEYVQITAAELGYVTSTNPASERFPERRRFVSALRAGEYQYERVAVFGDESRPNTLREDLLRAAIDPDLPGQERYVAVYRRTP